MSMFDYLYISSKLLPVSDEEKAILDGEEYQTKSLERNMDRIKIKKNGKLYIDGEWMYKIDDPNYKKLKFTGIINFYTFIGENTKNWYEFNAEFKEGKLIKIEKIE